MRLATRTSLAAAIAAALVVTLLAVALRTRVSDALLERVDRQLVERSATAPILAAVGDRLAVSEINGTVDGARIRDAGVARADTTSVGLLPDDPLPPITTTGWETAVADGQDWRLYTVEVADVPDVGDRRLVQLVAPLGDVDALARDQRRSMLRIALLAIGASALAGYGLGAVAARPLSRLRRDAAHVGTGPPDQWRVSTSYGAPEVDDVAHVLNDGFDRVAAASERREAALESARAFAATATHELRTPLTSALTNLDVARSVRADAVDPAELIALVANASVQLRRATSTLTALRELADAELADPGWFSAFDLGDDVAVLVDTERRRHPGTDFALRLPPGDTTVVAWRDGVRIAASNLVRNALRHGAPAVGRPSVEVSIDIGERDVTLAVADNGPGIPAADRERLLCRFERGAGESAEARPGLGIGLALVAQIATLHEGAVTIADRVDGAPGVSVSFTLRRHPA